MNLKTDPRQVFRQRRGLALASAALALLSLSLGLVQGCGGSGGVDSGGTGMGAQTLAVGPISGFGSIVVGGVHYDETTAHLEDADGHGLPLSALVLGAMTSIDASAISTSSAASGSRQDAQAQTVRISEAVIGPVDSVNVAGSSLHVLGQTVLVNAGTVFDGSLASGLAALSAGQVVAVHGLLDSVAGRVVATRIEPRTGATAYVVRGSVASLDRSTQRMGVGALTVALNDLASLPSGLAVGSVVRVKLRTSAAAGVWTASLLRLDGLALPDRDTVEIEGRVSAFTSVQHFSVDGVAVDAGAATVSGTVVLGARVEVSGSSSNGTLTARRVAVDSEDGGGSEAFEIEGRITAVDATAKTFVVRGVTVQWSDSTRFDSSTAADLALNRQVNAKGRLAADRSRVDATVVHVER
jgi:hypothetical protein